MELYLGRGQIEESKSDTIIVSVYENDEKLYGSCAAVDNGLKGAISELITSGDISGKLGEVTVLYSRGLISPNRVLVTGMGRKENITADSIRRSAAKAIKRAAEINAIDISSSMHIVEGEPIRVYQSIQSVIEGTLLSMYKYKSAAREAKAGHEIHSFTIVVPDSDDRSGLTEALMQGKKTCEGVYLARDLVNLPPNIATPAYLASVAEQIAKESNMKVLIGDRRWAEEHDMGAFLAVAKGAGEDPKFIILEHNSERNDLDTIVLVGKGITFDTGGISLKGAEGMGELKSDMGGAAAVLGTMKVVGNLNIPLHVIGIAPATENMPDANAYHPADVITASNGKTIEIISTDAEGRMILADGLVYAQKYKPNAVIDLATLTGACVTALGEGISAGLFTNEEDLKERLYASGSRTHERVWQLPLWDDYRDVIKSDVADMKNSGGGRGGVGSSAIFLKEFTNYPWVHLDIAPMALRTKANEYIPAGGSGYGVRLLVDFLLNWK